MNTKYKNICLVIDCQLFKCGLQIAVGKYLPVNNPLDTMSGRSNQPKSIMIYARNFHLDDTSDNSNLVLNYNIFAPAFGDTNTSVTIPMPADEKQINTAIRANVVAFALSTWSLTVLPSLVAFDTTGVLADSVNSYQTIVSQSGTAAPAVAGGFTPVSTYSGAPTFTWARTSAGVYTLTASSAIFNTSGKTGVFVAPLTNLNGSVKAVVTSTTVITVTTAVQSLAVLGLLGFTATPTDALLDKTMIYIQTYA